MKKVLEFLTPVLFIIACVAALAGACKGVDMFIAYQMSHPAKHDSVQRVAVWVDEHPALQTMVCDLIEDGTLSVGDYSILSAEHKRLRYEDAVTDLTTPCK